jgi:hypothetical protein
MSTLGKGKLWLISRLSSSFQLFLDVYVPFNRCPQTFQFDPGSGCFKNSIKNIQGDMCLI